MVEEENQASAGHDMPCAEVECAFFVWPQRHLSGCDGINEAPLDVDHPAH